MANGGINDVGIFVTQLVQYITYTNMADSPIVDYGYSDYEREWKAANTE